MINPFRNVKTSPEIIRLAVMMYVRFPLSLRNVEDIPHERGVDVSHETIRFWWNIFNVAKRKSGLLFRLRATGGGLLCHRLPNPRSCSTSTANC